MLSRHFSRSEIACKCGCGLDAFDIELIKILELIRYHFNVPVIINSGCRCEKHNKNIGGSPKSQHLLCKAADIVVKGVDPKIVYDFLDKFHKGGLGLYGTFIHIDVGPKRRWNG